MSNSEHPTGRPLIWTQEVRSLLYNRLHELFGPARNWDRGRRKPGQDMDAQYEEFMGHFNKVVGAAERGAELQIAFVFQLLEGDNIMWDQGHARTAMGNIVAALSAGFIRNSDLPKRILLETAPAL